MLVESLYKCFPTIGGNRYVLLSIRENTKALLFPANYKGETTSFKSLIPKTIEEKK